MVRVRKVRFRMAASAFLLAVTAWAITVNSLRSDRPLLTAAGYLLAMASALVLAWSLLDLSVPPVAAGKALVRRRLLAAWRVLCGHPVAYKVVVDDGGGIVLNDANKAVLLDVTVIRSTGDAVTLNGLADGKMAA